MRNFLNANDVFPILEMIRREIRKNDFNKDRIYLGDTSSPKGSTDEVTSVELFRGGNTFDPEMIDSVVVTYEDGSTENIALIRGVSPPVPETVPDYEFINKALITGFTVQVDSQYANRTVIGEIVRENRYGKIQRLNLSYV